MVPDGTGLGLGARRRLRELAYHSIPDPLPLFSQACDFVHTQNVIGRPPDRRLQSLHRLHFDAMCFSVGFATPLR